MGSEKGINVSRRIHSPSTAGVQDEMLEARTAQPANTFLRAVVVNVLNDVVSLSLEQLNSLKQTVSNPDFVDKAPRNSIVARIISSSQDKRGGLPLICYPFLPSHLALPVKSGEQIWVLYENPVAQSELPFWLWRISEDGFVEDPNYTHGDRKFDRSAVPKTSEKSANSTTYKPSFPNGGGTSASYTLKEADDYEKIVAADLSMKAFTVEPVPRFTKRPGDVVLQGSNNSLIVLGEARQGSTVRTGKEGTAGTACIDVVVGRGRTLPAPGSDPQDTAPRTIVNARNQQETDKNPAKSNKKNNVREGDPDFVNDASRLIVAQKLDGDKSFAIPAPSGLKTSIDNVSDKSFVVAKADELRLISRKEGSIRIVKEGTAGSDLAGVFILPDGIVQIDGSMLFLGRGGGGSGPGGSEPYIKFSVYKSQLTSIINELNNLLTTFSTGFAVPVAIPGTPHPGLTSLIPTITSTIANLTQIEAKLDEAKSERIFGE